MRCSIFYTLNYYLRITHLKQRRTLTKRCPSNKKLACQSATRRTLAARRLFCLLQSVPAANRPVGFGTSATRATVLIRPARNLMDGPPRSKPERQVGAEPDGRP